MLFKLKCWKSHHFIPWECFRRVLRCYHLTLGCAIRCHSLDADEWRLNVLSVASCDGMCIPSGEVEADEL